MSNFDLNIGGLLGAVICGVLVGVVLFAVAGVNGEGRGPYRLIIGAVIGGAIAGNFLWGLAFKKAE
ncbi:MAG TPA: hypothetical protein VL096_21975 [Pirellulaceae bacterium]|nr:hypothetical protein [Pirellulaceae bacterium]